MSAIARESLLSLEDYARQRAEFRARVIEHKKRRALRVGDSVTLIFEDELTIRYQIQEMLRVERIFEEAGIEDELDAYNPLVPDGSNWKATMLIEYADPLERKHWLARLIGVEDRVWVRVAGHDAVFAIADEDLERENGEKTSSVHFLRFELEPAMIAALGAGAALAVGIDHPACRVAVDPVPEVIRSSLCGDLHA
ncbi:DUF3501 family protein [Thauera sp. CAU 1555]|uniref:DUF3501 family protein n=1 Tax=Thauera sedimentorum TaxID=2767595 RepID=A0ABR9BHE7_9RHOO|nr:DUF3501 family protein [Thauera sedimentorum]MBC9073747.1 DUF3501 family protein [Thauera sedimentorum]MBD8504666.1 DUF3501 family protein [Thauera sedimentorum]